jgi:iron(III) transport system ATP-binding protein
VGEAAAVTARGVTKAFGGRTVLRGVDLDLPAGSLTAVLGPSGCGKTTLLRILAGFTDPDAGTVRIGDTVVAGATGSVPVHRRHVGLMPQEGALFPHLSVGDNVAFGMSRADRGRVAHWLEVVGLAGLERARPHEISGGQQQRVALARALAAQPRVLLLDEPFAALDAGLRGRVREDIAAILRAAGTTALLVTHDQAEALSLADSVALLLDGAVAQHASPPEVYEHPASLAVARFVGATVEVDGSARGGAVTTALGTLPARTPVPDGPATVVLRPEQLTLGAGAPARVRARHFYGADTVVAVELADGTALRVRVPGRCDAADVDAVDVGVTGRVLAYPAVSPAGRQRVSLGEAGG